MKIAPVFARPRVLVLYEDWPAAAGCGQTFVHLTPVIRPNRTTFRVFRGIILVAMVARAFWPSIDPVFVPFGFMMAPAVLITGNVLLAASFAFVIYVHKRMGPAWRSGVHDDPPRELITGGPFALSRNPMFLGVQVAQLGFFLSFPSLFTLVCLILGVAVLHLQTRLEEAQLRAAFGKRYLDYSHRVPRWIPLPGYNRQ